MKEKNKKNIATLAKVAVMGAVAAVVMLLEFPLPFIAPPFYQLDLSEYVVLLGGFALGPAAAVGIEAVKIVCNLLLNGTITFGVGEFANFVIGTSFVLTACIIYKYKKTKKGALIAMTVGTLVMMIVGCVVNAYVLIPSFAAAGGYTVDSIVAMATDINKNIDSLWKMMLLAVAPFNLIKGVVISALTFLSYKKLAPILKK